MLREDGSRVALILHLLYQGLDLIVTNTHITFPGEAEDGERRLREVKSLNRQLNEFVSERGVKAGCGILTGDFNGSVSDPVMQEVFQYVHGASPLAITCVAGRGTHRALRV